MRHQIRLHTQHDWLGFRVTEATVVFDHFRGAGGVDHQAGVEDTGVIVAFGGHAVDGWVNDLAHDAVVNVLGDHRRRGIGTHTAGVRAGVFVTDALVILAGGHWQYIFAIHHHNKGRFFTG